MIPNLERCYWNYLKRLLNNGNVWKHFFKIKIRLLPEFCHFALTWPLFSSVGNSSYRKCCNTVLWVIMIDHDIALTLLSLGTSLASWHGPLPLIRADRGSQQFNLRSIWALWNDNDCNICELLWCTCKHIFQKQSLIYEWLTLGGNLWLSTGWQLLVGVHPDRSAVRDIPCDDEFISKDHSPPHPPLASPAASECNFWLLRSSLLAVPLVSPAPSPAQWRLSVRQIQ